MPKRTLKQTAADKSGSTLQSAGITDGIVEGNTADSVVEPAAGKDVECPQPAEVHETTTGETVVSNAAPEQGAGAADKNAVCESSTDREEQGAVSGSVIHAQPICSANTTGVGEDSAAQVLSVPIYTDKDILALLQSKEEQNIADVIMKDLESRMEQQVTAAGVQQAGDLVAISKELFPHIAMGYMNPEHRAMDELIAKTDKLHDAQREREISLSTHLYDQQVAMEDSFFDLCN